MHCDNKTYYTGPKAFHLALKELLKFRLHMDNSVAANRKALILYETSVFNYTLLTSELRYNFFN